MTSHAIKHQTRFLAIKGLYWRDVNQDPMAIEEMIDTLMAEEDEIKEVDIPLFTALIGYVRQEQAEYDALIQNNMSKDWKFERLGQVLLAILRAAIAELKHFPDTPFKVVIDEYASLTAYFCDDKEVAFVNAILQSLTQTIRPDEPA